MANEKNLTPFNKMTPERQREIARMGGKASGAARRTKYGKWILSKDKAPEIPCLYCDGFESNGVKACTVGMVTHINKKTGEKLYFDGDSYSFTTGLKFAVCEENSIIAWMPFPERYKGDGG